MFTMVLAAWREQNEDLRIKQLRHEREFRFAQETKQGSELKKVSESGKEAV